MKTNAEFIIKFGKNLRKVRKARGISMEALSFDAKIEYTTLSRIELAQVSANLDTIKMLADCLNIPVKELFDF